MSIKMNVFRDVAPCSLEDIDRRFGGPYLKCRSITTRLRGVSSEEISHLLCRDRNSMHSSVYQIIILPKWCNNRRDRQ